MQPWVWSQRSARRSCSGVIARARRTPGAALRSAPRAAGRGTVPSSRDRHGRPGRPPRARQPAAARPAAAPPTAVRTGEADAARRCAASRPRHAPTRRAEHGACETARTRAEALRAQADERWPRLAHQAGAHLAEARRAGAAEVEKLTRDLDRQQSAHDARVARLDDLEARLDGSGGPPGPAAQALQKHAGELAERKAELDAREQELEQERLRLAGGRAARTSASSSGSPGSPPRRPAPSCSPPSRPRPAATPPLLVRTIESEARAEGTERRARDRRRGGPARRERADHRVGGQRAAPARRRDEGPHHRPRGPQHPRLRVGHRRQRDHRRHPRGGAAVVLRPGAPRGRPAHAREAGRWTAASTRSASRRSYELSKAEVEQLCLRAARDAAGRGRHRRPSTSG